MTDEQKSDQLCDLLSALPEDAQYAIYHSMTAAGGRGDAVKPMSADETETAKEIYMQLHKKFMFGYSR